MKISWKHLLLCTLIILFGDAAEKVSSDKDVQDDDKYRLPTSIIPISYEINLMPNLENFTFAGIVKITARVKEETNTITLHMGSFKILSETVVETKENKTIDTSSFNDPDTEQYILNLNETLQSGIEIVIAFTYEGNLSDNMLGFYKSSYKDENGDIKWLAATQFETTHARHAFPCFDEPMFKAKFTIRILRKEKYTCLSNMPIQKTDKAEGELWDVFKESVDLPTYLVAFVVSEFQNLSQKLERDLVEVWARPSVIKQAKFASEIGSEALNLFNEKFSQTKHEFPKMDMVAIPDFDYGAMENWGLVTYREARMLYDENESSTPAEQSVASVVVHELAHTWFGNMLTPEWWGDLWLSEGFARYYQYFATAKLRPNWKMEDQFVVEQHQSILIADGLKSSEPMSREVSNNLQVAKMIDSITYAKGASIIRMMDHQFGTEVFESALQNYIITNKDRGLTNPDALWVAIQSEINSKNLSLPDDVKTIMETWTKKAGYPVVSITIDKDLVRLNQKRFFLRDWETPTDSTDIWWIPLTWTRQNELNFENTVAKKWMSKEEDDISLALDPNEWIIFNIQSSGFYRVNYDSEGWRRIFDALHNNIDDIPALSRAVIIDDLLNLGRAGYQNYKTVIDGIKYLEKETEYLPFKAALNGLDYLNKRFAGYPKEQELLKNFVLSLIENRRTQLEYEDDENDSRLNVLLRRELNNLACNLDDEQCKSHYLNKFEQWKENAIPIKPNERTTAYCTAIRYGNASDWEFLWQKYSESNYPTDQIVILDALGCTDDETIIEKYLTYATTDYEINGIRKQDSESVFAAVYNSGIKSAEYVLNFVENHYKEMETYYGGLDSIVTILNGASQRFSTEDLINKFEKFIQREDFELIRESLQSSLKIAKQELEWYKSNSISIIQGIQEGNEEKKDYLHDIIPEKYDIFIKLNFDASEEFEGNVMIEAKVQQNTDQIVLHSAEMKLPDTVKVKINDEDEIEIPFEEQKENESLIIKHKLSAEDRLIITIPYTGTLRPSDHRGFYKSSYLDKNGKERWFAATQLEPTSARKMFPCFDEPAMKANFILRANIPSDYYAVSNMKGQPVTEGDRTNYIFKESEKMSSYLVAIIISDFEINYDQNNSNYAVLARPNAINQTKYALKLIKPLVTYFETTFGQEYQLETLYMAALPTFPTGAMENWGLLTYKESNLLYDENYSTVTSKQAIRNVIAHEISHQWFGNLVTLAWWKYVWLNEGFARYFQYNATSVAFDDSTLESQFVVNEVHSALSVDSSKFTHPLTHNVSKVSEIRSIFDTISYAKGASILRMLEKSFGSKVFKAALSDYLDKNQYGIVKPEDLYSAFQEQIGEESYNITTILDSWTTQPGYPVVTVTVDLAKKLLTFEQKRFFLKKEEDVSADMTWHIPITWTLIGKKSNTEPQLWLEDKPKSHPLQTSSLFMCNSLRSGYYRVNYDKTYLSQLINYFENPQNNINAFNEIDRAAFIDDLMNLARADYVDYKDVISATMYLTRERNYVPWRAFFNNLPYLSNRFRGRHVEELYKKYLTYLIEPLYNYLKFEDNQTDNDLTKMLRIQTRKWACELNIGDCVYQATKPLTDIVSPNSRGVSYCMIMQTGKKFDYLWEKYLKSNVASEKLDILSSMACSRNPDVLKRLLEETLKGTFIRHEDGARVFSNVYSESLTGVEAVINFIRERYEDMKKYFGHTTIDSMLSSLASRLSTNEVFEKYKNLIAIPSIKDEYETESYLSTAKYEFEWYEKKSPIVFYKLDQWFSKDEPSGVHTKHRLPKVLYPKLYDLQVTPSMEEGTFEGEVKISMIANEETTSIVLNSHNLKISDIKVKRNENEEINVLGHDLESVPQVLKIYLAKVVKMGEEIEAKIVFSGTLNDDMKGFYRSSYIEDGTLHWLATTQFEPTYARQAFPCFDEPEYKSQFEIRIQRPKNYNSLSNMPIQKSTLNASEWDLDVFEKTKVNMSVYSVAFIVSEFDPVNNNKVTNVWGRPEIADDGEYAQELAEEILDKLETITGINYALPKLDLVGIPDFAMGAMENWGLVTSREYGLFYNKRITTATNEQYIITIIAHELAHMWFGNLITCEWWDYIWLNEGFAEYFQWVVADEIKPEYKFMDQFVVYELQPALQKDASISTHSMTMSLDTPQEISRIFDYVAYGKSASILRMLFNAIDEQSYKAALSHYLREQSKVGTAKPTDLWKSFDLFVSIPIDDRQANVEEVMNTWTDQPGYPVVNATLENGILTLTQERFVINKESEDNRFYWIPIHIKASLDDEDDKNYKITLNRKFWLGSKPRKVLINPLNEWFIVNYKQTGFYRVNYDDASWALLIDELNSERFENIHVLNRAQIIDDLFNLAATSYVKYELLLNAMKYLSREKNHLPWKAFFNNLPNIYERFEGQNYQTELQKTILKLMSKMYDTVGFEDISKDTHLDKLNREMFLEWACKLNQAECIQRSKQLFKNWFDNIPSRRVPVNAQPAVYCTAVREGTESEWNFLWQKYLNSNFGSEKKIILNALGCSKDEAILRNYLKEAITKKAPGKAVIRRQDVLAVFSSVYSASPSGVNATLDILLTNISAVYEYFDNWGEITGLFFNVASHVSNEKQFHKFYEFLESGQYTKLPKEVAFQFNLAVTIANNNLLWYTEHGKEIGEALKKELGEGDTGISARIEPMNIIFMTLIALVSYFLSYH